MVNLLCFFVCELLSRQASSCLTPRAPSCHQGDYPKLRYRNGLLWKKWIMIVGSTHARRLDLFFEVENDKTSRSVGRKELSRILDFPATCGHTADRWQWRSSNRGLQPHCTPVSDSGRHIGTPVWLRACIYHWNAKYVIAINVRSAWSSITVSTQPHNELI